MINIPKGTKDMLPQEAYKWQFIEEKAMQTARLFNLKQIRTPVFEHTELFLRGVGDTTDIVNKEMYTFNDKGNRSMTLKPEGTAGVARSFIENNMQNGVLPVKTFYFTPVFRYENPQAGRLREHHQFGIELFGGASAQTDAEVIFLAQSFLNALGITEVELNINSIGCKTCRVEYARALREYFAPYEQQMCALCRDRLVKNPLRVLDCKVEDCKKITAGAPRTIDYLCDDCRAHFEKLKEYLALAGISYKINPSIVRGLDYYTKTVFEFVSTAIGSQGTVCGGGRYDTLIENLGGSPIPAVGFGSGIERLILLMDNTGVPFPEDKGATVYLAGMDEVTRNKCFEYAVLLRKNGISADYDHMQRSLKAQFKYADRAGVKFVVVIGGDELESGRLTVKRLATGESSQIDADALISFVKDEN